MIYDNSSRISTSEMCVIETEIHTNDFVCVQQKNGTKHVLSSSLWNDGLLFAFTGAVKWIPFKMILIKFHPSQTQPRHKCLQIEATEVYTSDWNRKSYKQCFALAPAI